MSELVDLVDEVLKSDLVKTYRSSFNKVVFIDNFDLEDIYDENRHYCEMKGIIVDINTKELYIDKEELYKELESRKSASLLELIQFRILLGLGFLNIQKTSKKFEDIQYWVISFHHAVASILQNDINNEYGYELMDDFYYFFRIVTGRSYFTFKTNNNKLVRSRYKITYQQMA